MTERRISSAGPPPTASRNKRVAREAQVPDDERDAVVGVPGRRQRVDLETSGLDRPGHDLEREALDELVVAGDMVGMSMGDQEMRRRDALALDRGEQRLERRAGVDEDGRPSGLVGEQEGIREPRLVHAALDDHRPGILEA